MNKENILMGEIIIDFLSPLFYKFRMCSQGPARVATLNVTQSPLQSDALLHFCHQMPI